MDRKLGREQMESGAPRVKLTGAAALGATLFSVLAERGILATGLLCALTLFAFNSERHTSQPRAAATSRYRGDIVRVTLALGVLLNWQYLGGNWRMLAVHFIFLCLAIARFQVSSSSWRAINSPPVQIFLIVAILDTSNYHDVFVTLSTFLLILSSLVDHSVRMRVRISLVAAATNLAFGFLLALAGVEAPYAGDLKVQESATRGIGLGRSRWRFPIGRSWEDAAFLGLLVLLFAIFLTVYGGMSKVILLSVAALGMLVVLAANGRVFLFVALALPPVMLLVSRARLFFRLVPYGSIALSFIPFWWSAISPLTGQLAQTSAQSGFTDSIASLSTLEGRTTIWQVCREVLRQLDFSHLLLGFGPNGYISSGAAYQYAFVFGGGSGATWRASFYSPHNIGLLLLFSVGLLGSVVLTAIVVAGAWSRLPRLPRQTRVIVTMCGFVWAAAGATSVVVSPSGMTSALLFYGLFASLLVGNSRGLEDGPAENTGPSLPLVRSAALEHN